MSLVLLFNGQGGYTPPVSTYGFTQPKDVIVRVQALDGAWETCGADRARGIVPENVQLVSDQWGSKTASFDLRRDPKAIWPDISAFAPVEVEVGGRLVWSGRVSETPVRDSTDSVIGVQCEGWQAHLDDDLYERIYAHTNLTDWKDARSDPAATLTTLLANWQVTAGDGKISLMCPQGTSPGGRAAVVLDLGPNSTAKRVVVDWSITARQAASGNRAFYFGSSNTSGDAGGSPTLTTISSSTTATSGTFTNTLATEARYLFLAYDANTYGSACSADDGVTITSVQVFADTAYESANASVLKADQVVKDALSRATLLLSSDQSGISAGTFSIPELAPSDPKTPREMWNAVNAFEDYQAEIDVLKRPVFRAKPSSPEVEVGAWSGMEFEDSSANSGGDVYSGVVITCNQADGSPLRVRRTQSQQASANSVVLTSPTFTNATFETNVTGWTASSSTVTRDTGNAYSGTAGARWDKTGASDSMTTGVLTGTLTGTWRAGVSYTVWYYVKSAGTVTFFNSQLGSATDRGPNNTRVYFGTTGWERVPVSWTPQNTVSASVTLTLTMTVPAFLSTVGGFLYVDDFVVMSSNDTVVERRGFARTKQIASNFTLTTTAAQQIADKWLLAHKTSPFKGRAKLTGNQACREIKTGRPVKPEELLLRTGELIRFGDRIDPDTGATGRDGRLVEAQYEADTDSVTLTIDSSRAGFEALLERLGVVLGQNRFS